ncbi:hypothetical protein ACSNOI_24910 [Actinomadura kijaniata]|uniref:hypothetical protein n=1 Tax=Actinomadura kijaniata TaxID=46161 RepID=UPI003F1D3FE1
MPAVLTLDRADQVSTVPTVGPCPWSARETTMTLLSQDLSRERIPDAVLAARVRAMRRARRDARTRAARVSRVLLAPVAAPGPRYDERH